MKQTITVVFATVALTMGASGAFAADMGRPAMSYKAPPPAAPVMSWTGFYVGGDAGGVWSNNSATWNPLPSPAVFGVNAISSHDKDSGFIGGLHGGYNYQFAPTWVAGIEGDWMWSSEKASWTQPWSGFPAGPAVAGTFTTMSQRLDWLSSIRGRLGYVISPNLMAYGTGGVAFARFDDAASNFSGGAGAYNTAASDHSTQTGLTVGGGLEYMLTTNWSVRAEYLYYHFKSGPNTIATSVSFPAFPSNYAWGSTNISVARAGVSYKF